MTYGDFKIKLLMALCAIALFFLSYSLAGIFLFNNDEPKIIKKSDLNTGSLQASGTDSYAQYKFNDPTIEEPLPPRKPDTWFAATSCKSFVDLKTIPTDGVILWQQAEYLPGQFVWAYETMADWENASDALYKVGTVVQGKYKNYEVLFQTSVYSGLGPVISQEHFLRSGKKIVSLNNEPSNDGYGQAFNVVPGFEISYDPSYVLTDLLLDPSYEALSGDKLLYFDLATSSGITNPFSYGETERLCLDGKKNWFSGSHNTNLYGDVSATPTSFSVARPDGTSREYRLRLGVLGDGSIPKVTWSNGKRPSIPYSYRRINFCGESYPIDVAPYETFDKLVVIGKTDDGLPVYGYNDSSKDAVYKNMYEEYSTRWQNEAVIVSYEAYLKDVPVFFVENQLGQLVRYINGKHFEGCYYG